MSNTTFREAINGILARLSEQATIYSLVPDKEREEMRYRALVVAYSTAHTESRVAVNNLTRGFMMQSMRRAIERRALVHPSKWDRNQGKGKTRLRWADYPAKARFARALSGYSLGPDAVCLDVHMLRLPVGKRPRNAYQQWAKWFRVYRDTYGEDRARWAIDWHRRLLDHVALIPGIYIEE